MSNIINHPEHYTQGSIECIDAMESMLTPEQFQAHCRACAFKYIWRTDLKGDRVENIQKAQWYLQRMQYSIESNARLDDLRLAIESDDQRQALNVLYSEEETSVR